MTVSSAALAPRNALGVGGVCMLVCMVMCIVQCGVCNVWCASIRKNLQEIKTTTKPTPTYVFVVCAPHVHHTAVSHVPPMDFWVAVHILV